MTKTIFPFSFILLEVEAFTNFGNKFA